MELIGGNSCECIHVATPVKLCHAELVTNHSRCCQYFSLAYFYASLAGWGNTFLRPFKLYLNKRGVTGIIASPAIDTYYFWP
mmetsp:Transcript_9973/g.21079  ORF Transcript_9973/g.21079 Transcript_9973/m.21079 type:complete len:82 (+) Transcript_9973:225-470(+)